MSANWISTFAPMAQLIDESLIALREGVEAVERYESDLEADPQRQEWVEDRLATMESIARKHRVEVSALLGPAGGSAAGISATRLAGSVDGADREAAGSTRSRNSARHATS